MSDSGDTRARRVPRQERSRAIVEAILEAARRILTHDGLAALTTSRIADLAGVSVGSLYRYFPNKQAIVAAVLETLQDEESRASADEDAIVERVSRVPPEEAIRAIVLYNVDYHRQQQLPIKVIRIFNTYGPHMHPHDGRVVSNFIVQALKGAPLTLYGDGSQTRSFCYVDDLVDGIVRMMESPEDVIGPVNLGNPDEFTMVELAQLVLEMTGSRSELRHGPLPSDDPSRRCPDITRARTLLDWQPTTKLREGLKPTIAYFDKLL